MTMLRRSLFLSWVLMLALGVGAARADPIGPGFDLLATPPGGAILPPIAQLGLGPTPLVGNPIDPANIGTTDTIVQRFGSLGDDETGRIPAELVGLSLMSMSPVLVPQLDAFFDVFLTLDNRLGTTGSKLRPSVGFLEITTHENGGGLFDSFFDVFTKVTFVPVDDGEPFVVFSPGSDPISSTNTPWSHTPLPFPLEGTEFTLPDGDPPYFAGNFWITPEGIDHTGPHPRTVPPSEIPEPASLLLFGAIFAGLGAVTWRRRHSK